MDTDWFNIKWGESIKYGGIIGVYINFIMYRKLQRDILMCPLTLWNEHEIKRFMKWIERKVGYGRNRYLLLNLQNFVTFAKYV